MNIYLYNSFVVFLPQTMKINLLTSILFFLFISLKAQDIGPQNANDTVNLQQLTDYVSTHYFSKTPKIELYAEKAITLAKKINDEKTLANLYRMAGVIQYFNGKHELALKYYFDALKIFEKLNTTIGKVEVNNEIGTLYRKNNRLEEAIAIFKKTLLLAESIKDTGNMAKTLNNTGIVYEVQNNLPLALIQYNKALQFYIKIRDTIGLSYCYENIGGVYLIQKKYNESEKYLLLSYQFRKQLNLQQASAFSLHYLGELYQKKGDLPKALSNFLACSQLAEQIKYPDIKQRAFYSIAEVYKKSGNTTKALNYYEKATTLKDSLFNIERNLQLTEMQTKYEVENKNNENKLLKQTVEIEKQQAKNRQLLYFFTTALLLITVIGIAIYYSRKRQLTAIQTQLKIQEAEYKQRLRISNDLHDNVGAQLSYVVSNLEISNQEIAQNKVDKNRITSITEMSKNAILTLRETVWALNNEKISIESFSDKFKTYTQKMTEFSKHLTIEMKENIAQNDSIPPNTALHLFRICQESLSNAIKHAQASKLIIEISNSKTNLFNFKLIDNGIGFDMNEAQLKGHYGLQNMKSRALEVGAQYDIETQKNKGTKIELNLTKIIE